MPEIISSFSTSFQVTLFLFSFFLIFFSGLANDTLSSKDDNKDTPTKTFSGDTRITIAIICSGIAAVVLFSIILFKIWQKKKREEQYARLQKLFEEDGELEVELGLRE